MSDVKVTDLRQNLPTYLAKVSRGEKIRVTSRGRVVAEIVPPSVDSQKVAAARARLRNSVLRYDQPLVPVLPADEWEMNQ